MFVGPMSLLTRTVKEGQVGLWQTLTPRIPATVCVTTVLLLTAKQSLTVKQVLVVTSSSLPVSSLRRLR